MVESLEPSVDWDVVLAREIGLQVEHMTSENTWGCDLFHSRHISLICQFVANF